MAHLHIYALGRLRLQFGQAEVSSFPTRHVEELLGYLLLNQRIHHSREKLIEILWPYSSPTNARGRFSTVLWRLRTVFEHVGVSTGDYLQVARDWVAFVPAQPIAFDVADFEALLNQTLTIGETLSGGGETLNAGAHGRQEEMLRTAVSLYQGELCEGIYADWCLLERERMARYYLRVMGQLMACLIQHQEYEEAISLGDAILQIDPIREEVHRALMYCYWQMGQPMRALRQFDTCTRLLADELKAMPMPETVTLYRQIMADRLNRVQIATVPPDHFRAQLQAAFHDFEKAGNRLTSLLERVEV
jgi:DNA-binding SARP family transcriptional activator